MATLFVIELLLHVSGFQPEFHAYWRIDDRLRNISVTPYGVVLWGHPRASRKDIEHFVSSERPSFKLVGLGDSIMNGVDDETAYLAMLPALVHRPIETLNLAVPGYNTAQEAAVFREMEEQAHLKRADLVVVHLWRDDSRQFRAIGEWIYGGIDSVSNDGRELTGLLPSSMPPLINEWLLIHSRVYQQLTETAVSLRHSFVSTGWNVVFNSLTDIHRRASRMHARVVVLVSPAVDKKWPEAIGELPSLQTFGEQEGIEVVNVAEWFSGIESRSVALDMGADDCHLNAAGHRIIAENLANMINRIEE